MLWPKGDSCLGVNTKLDVFVRVLVCMLEVGGGLCIENKVNLLRTQLEAAQSLYS